jgi:hypothetical protein
MNVNLNLLQIIILSGGIDPWECSAPNGFWKQFLVEFNSFEFFRGELEIVLWWPNNIIIIVHERTYFALPEEVLTANG